MLQSYLKLSSLRQYLQTVKFHLLTVFQVLIVPWPTFGIFLMLFCLIGFGIPILQIKAITALVAILTDALSPIFLHEKLPLREILTLVLPWLLIFIGSFIIPIHTLQQYLSNILQEQVRRVFGLRYLHKSLNMRLELFERPTYFDSMQRAKEVLRSKLIDQANGVQRLLGNSCSIIAICWQTAQVHVGLPLILLLGTIISVRFTMYNAEQWRHINLEQTPERRRLTYWRNLLTGRQYASEVRLFGLSEHFIRTWHNLNHQVISEKQELRSRAWYTDATEFLFSATVVPCLAYSVLIYMLIQENLNLGSFIALVYIIGAYQWMLYDFGVESIDLVRSLGELNYLPEYLTLIGEERRGGQQVPKSKTGIVFENVSFHYPGSEKMVLRDFNLHIQIGERISLIGENGSGKSTFVKLLLGLYQPTKGRILSEGVDIQTIDLHLWRATIGVVMQDFMRYSFSARENIGFGKVEQVTNLPTIQQAAQLSGIDNVILGLIQGYETILGKEFSGGQDLSKGQWQKIAIARTIFRNSNIVILDEPTASLDARAEQQVYREFLNLSKDKTALLISHRIGSARLADRIIYLHDGMIVETGTHEELIAANGYYATLYKLQAEWYQDGAKSGEQNT